MAYTADLYADEIRRLYVEQHKSLRSIERILREEFDCPVTHEMIRRVLRRKGISTAKSSLTGGHRLVVCRTCGRPKEIPRHRVRDSLGRGRKPHNPHNHYCDTICRFVWLEEHCAGQARARGLVEYLLGHPLPPEAVCHFVDGRSGNVVRQNIKVFTSTNRHIEEHRTSTSTNTNTNTSPMD